MDIGSNGQYPCNALSNFATHTFTIDNVECRSMEGFLQSLKFENPDMQVEVCKLFGVTAKRKGAHKNWKDSQTLHWQGVSYKRDSDEYKALLTRAYTALVEQSASFRSAIKAAQNAVFSHSIGKNKKTETVLTEREFCQMLNMAREIVNKIS